MDRRALLMIQYFMKVEPWWTLYRFRIIFSDDQLADGKA